MNVTGTAQRWLPPRLMARLEPRLVQVDTLLFSRDQRAAAQRMSLVAFAIRIASAAIAFVSQIILARIMGAFEYGIFVFVWAIAVIIGALSCIGFDIAVIRFLPHYRTSGSHAEIRGLVVTARLTAMVVAALVGAIGIAALVFFGSAIPTYYVVPLYLGILMLPMIALGDALDGTSRANGWVITALMPAYLMRPVLILVFVAAAVFFYGAAADAQTALVCALVATYAASFGQYLVVSRRVKRQYVTTAFSVDIGPWLRVAFPIFVVEGLYFLLTNSDVVVVGLFLDPDKVAVYFAAAKCMALVHFVYFAVKAGAGPRFAEIALGGNRGALAESAAETARWTFWPSLVVGGTVLLLGPFLLSLFGPDFGAGLGLMAILYAGIMAKALVGPGEALLTMADQQAICVAVYAGAFAVNILLDVTLIPLYGLYGAAVATASAMVAEAVLLHIVVRRRLGITLFAFAGGPRRGATAGEGVR